LAAFFVLKKGSTAFLPSRPPAGGQLADGKFAKADIREVVLRISFRAFHSTLWGGWPRMFHPVSTQSAHALPAEEWLKPT